MRNIRSNNKNNGFGGNRSGRSPRRNMTSPQRSRGRSDFRDRDSGGFERKKPRMNKVICDKCGMQCEVPFKPTGDKPVLCSDCFKKKGGSNSGFIPRNNVSSSGISGEQYKELNKKLDKILRILEMIEFEDDEEYEDEDDEEQDDSEDEEA